MTSPISTPGAPVEILKQDQRGRVRTPVERREALLNEFEGSSLSGVKFAAMVGVKYATFANWVQKRKKARQAQAGEGAAAELRAAPARRGPVRLFEAFAEVAGSSRGAGLVVELPGGGRLQVESPVQLELAAELLRLLSAGGARPC
jgi:hypothetical protein